MIENPVNAAFMAIERIRQESKRLDSIAGVSWSHIHSDAISDCWGDDVSDQQELIVSRIKDVLNQFRKVEEGICILEDCLSEYKKQCLLSDK